MLEGELTLATCNECLEDVDYLPDDMYCEHCLDDFEKLKAANKKKGRDNDGREI